MDGHQRVASIFKATAHPVRLRILEVLWRDGEACVCHLESALRLRQAYISQQLAKLRSVGLVVDRRDGLNIYYSLSHGAIAELLTTARETASQLANKSGESLHFTEVDDFPSLPCNCPRCSLEGGSINAEQPVHIQIQS